MSKTVMIVAGETSGELYGALLAESLKNKIPDLIITGIGGERMKEAGVNLIAGISSAFGIAEAFSSIKVIRETFKKAINALNFYKPSVLVLIDYPDFNLRLAKEAKKRNISVLYYVSPQVWAWRAKRVHRIASLVDTMAVILPFEEEIYRKEGLRCEFVGHPIFDEIKQIKIDRKDLRQELGLNNETPVLSLLPGSRPGELNRHLSVIVDTVKQFRQENMYFQFCIPFAPNTDIENYRESISALKDEGAIISKGNSLKVMHVSDYGVIASGTASLQAALLGLPAVIIYRLSPLTYWLGKMIVNVRHISLVNILTGREVVRELMQEGASPANIIKEIKRIITDAEYRKQMEDSYAEVRKIFEGKKASERVAEMVIEMSGWQKV